MKTATVVRDKLSGTPFAVLVSSNGGLRVFGASGQGYAWAQWAEKQNSLDSVLSSLDITLVHEKDVELSTEFIDSIAKDFDQQTIGDMRSLAAQKSLLVFTNTKSDPEPDKTDFEEMNDFSEEEDVSNWPITDAALASIDVAYKQIAINYKAKAFKVDTQRAGILLQVKGVRALWDPNMPGGGGWRCPDDTPNGGQFTNRLGRGCTFGMMRRIGRSLVAASLRDISKAVDDAANIDLPTVNRAGRALTSAADARDARLQNKFKNRAQRRARKLSEVKAKEQLKQGAITWRQAYESLDKDKTRRGRARIATALVAKRMADDAAVRAFNSETRRQRRRAGRVVEKTPPPSPGGAVSTQNVSPGQQGGPSRREILAERLRRSAQNIVGEDQQQTRRMSRRARRGAQQIQADEPVDTDYTPPQSPARGVRGQTPSPAPIATRFARGENESRMSEIQAIRRELRGEQPRSTTPFRERIARRQRRRAARIAGEIPDDADYADYESSRIDLPRLKDGPLEANAFMGRGPDAKRVDPILRDIPAPPGRGEGDFIPQGDTPAREEYLEKRKDWLNEDIVFSLNNLQKFFEHRASHGKLREARSDDSTNTEQVQDALINAGELLDAFDAGSQDELKEIYENWQREFNDPNLPSPEGYVSNLGRTISRQDDVDGMGRTVLYAADVPGNPIVYIEDSDKGIAHLLDTKGRHVLSMFTDDNGEVRFMSGSAAAETIARRGMRRPIRERIMERLNRRDSDTSPAQQMSLRARRIAVERSKTRSGLSFGKTTSGDIYAPVGSGPEVEQGNLIIAQNVKDQLARYDDSFRRRLNITDPDQPLAEDAILSYIDELAKTDARQAGIMKTRLHDFLVMTEIDETGDLNLVNNLKPSARERVLDGVPSNVRSPRKGRYALTPYRPSGARNINPEDITPPILVNAPVNTMAPINVPSTGIPLTPGLGNPSLGINYDPSSGLYIDSATGLFVEDLTGLPIDRTSVYDAVPRPDMDAGNYPIVRVSPPGILPPRYVRLAPGTDPDGAGKAGTNNVVGVARNHNEAMEMFAVSEAASLKPGSSEAAVARILGRSRPTILQNQTTRIDARNRMSAANTDPTITSPDMHPVKNFTLGELLNIGQSSSGSDIMTTPKAPQWIEAGDGDLNKPIGSDSSLRPVFEKLGIDIDMPIGEFYIPSSAETSTDVTDSIASLNRALQAQHVAEIGNRITGLPAYDEDSRLVELWNTAADDLAANLKVAQVETSRAVDELTQNKRNKQGQWRLLKSGHQEELLSSLLESHVVSNPVAMQALEIRKRKALESSANKRNARIRAAQARAARGIRAAGSFDDQPDILDPWGSSNPPAAPRSLDDILSVHVQHKAEGLFENPFVNGTTQLSDEQVDALSSMGELYDLQRGGNRMGLPGTPYDGVQFGDTRKAMLAHMWHFNGYNSLPILATKEEMLAAAEGPLTPEGTQPVFFIARGVQGSPAQQVQFITDMLGGDRFVPGQGGQAAGLGDYWSLQPGGWSSYHGGNGGTAIAILSPQMNIVSRDAHLELFGTQNGTPLYESLWSIYNAIGAPDAPNGVNPSHGPESRFGIAPNSILPDPKTGLFTQAQLDELNGHVARLTAEGTPGRKLRNNAVWSDTSGWGEATIERSLTTGSHSGTLKRALTLDIVGNTPEETLKAQEAIERRKEINSWFAQHLSWFVQLAQLRRDESLPGQVGIDNKAHNAKLNRAMRSLLYMDPDVRAVLMGIDAYAADSVAMDTVLRSNLWQAIQQGAGDRIVVLNRSAMIMHREPVKVYSDWTNDLLAIKPQVPGVSSPIDGRGWR